MFRMPYNSIILKLQAAEIKFFIIAHSDCQTAETADHASFKSPIIGHVNMAQTATNTHDTDSYIGQFTVFISDNTVLTSFSPYSG